MMNAKHDKTCSLIPGADRLRPLQECNIVDLKLIFQVSAKELEQEETSVSIQTLYPKMKNHMCDIKQLFGV